MRSSANLIYKILNNLKVTLSIFFILLPIFILYGCGAKIPTCNDSLAIDTAKSIINQSIEDGKLDLKPEQFIFEFIETVSKDEKTEKSQCKATIKFKPSDESIRILKTMQKPSLESSQAIFAGLIAQMEEGDQAPPLLIAISGLGAMSIAGELLSRDASQKKVFLNEIVYKFSKDTSKYPIIFNALISEEIEKNGKAKFNDGTITFKQNEINYSIRKNEDKNTKNDFLVEAKFSSDVADVVSFISNLIKQEQFGKQLLEGVEKKPVSAPAPAPAPAPQVNNTPFAPSFDCSKANTGPESLICGDRDLAKLDVDVNQAFGKARDKATDKNQLRSEQISWMKSSRNSCSDKDCMIKSMNQRIVELSK